MTWVSTLQKHISENLVSDEEFKTVEQRFPNNPPQSKEEYYYRSIFIRSYLSIFSKTKCQRVFFFVLSSKVVTAIFGQFVKMVQKLACLLSFCHHDTFTL